MPDIFDKIASNRRNSCLILVFSDFFCLGEKRNDLTPRIPGTWHIRVSSKCSLVTEWLRPSYCVGLNKPIEKS